MAIIDSGIDYNHEDLAANVFRNEADCNDDGIDNDGNGFVDDCHGIAPINGTSDPMDDHSHGTHVAGHHRRRRRQRHRRGGRQLEREADGVQDVRRRRQRHHRRRHHLPRLRRADEGPRRQHRRDQQQLERQPVLRGPAGRHRGAPGARHPLHRRRRELSFQCAFDPYNCRTDTDNDRKPNWPSSFYLPNIISVANGIDYGCLNAASGRGRHTVHLAAPGSWILSTTPGNTYDYFSGTSMATPHVTGVAALLKAQRPARDWRAIKNLILAGAEGDLFPDDDDLITKMRLNARGSLACRDSTVTVPAAADPRVGDAVVGRPMELPR